VQGGWSHLIRPVLNGTSFSFSSSSPDQRGMSSACVNVAPRPPKSFNQANRAPCISDNGSQDSFLFLDSAFLTWLTCSNLATLYSKTVLLLLTYVFRTRISMSPDHCCAITDTDVRPILLIVMAVCNLCSYTFITQTL
jgi:hypothetical protein